MFSSLYIWMICGTVLKFIANSQSLPHFKHVGRTLSNNSFINYPDIHRDDTTVLKCMTDRESCCNESNIGGWSDWRGGKVHGVDGVTCLYVTRGDGVISLNRKRGCTDHTSGLWRCDIPDSSGEMQSLYIYISNKISKYGEFITFFCATLYSTVIQEIWPTQCL